MHLTPLHLVRLLYAVTLRHRYAGEHASHCGRWVVTLGHTCPPDSLTPRSPTWRRTRTTFPQVMVSAMLKLDVHADEVYRGIGCCTYKHTRYIGPQHLPDHFIVCVFRLSRTQ